MSTKQFRRWLALWWQVHHPGGGGEAPSLENAFVAGWNACLAAEANRTIKRQGDLFTED